MPLTYTKGAFDVNIFLPPTRKGVTVFAKNPLSKGTFKSGDKKPAAGRLNEMLGRLLIGQSWFVTNCENMNISIAARFNLSPLITIITARIRAAIRSVRHIAIRICFRCLRRDKPGSHAGGQQMVCVNQCCKSDAEADRQER